MMKRSLLVLLALLILGSIANAVGDNVIYVKCYNENWQPISGAKIVLMIGSHPGPIRVTNSSGAYAYQNLANASYKLQKVTPSPTILTNSFSLNAEHSPRMITFVNPNQVYYSEEAALSAYMKYVMKR